MNRFVSKFKFRSRINRSSITTPPNLSLGSLGAAGKQVKELQSAHGNAGGTARPKLMHQPTTILEENEGSVCSFPLSPARGSASSPNINSTSKLSIHNVKLLGPSASLQAKQQACFAHQASRQSFAHQSTGFSQTGGTLNFTIDDMLSLASPKASSRKLKSRRSKSQNSRQSLDLESGGNIFLPRLVTYVSSNAKIGM